MSTYHLECRVTVSAATTVVADTEAEAISIAKRRGVELVGSAALPDEAWIIDDADGMPADVVISSEDA